MTIGLGVSLFILTDFGADPFTMLVNGVHIAWPSVSAGAAHMGISFLLMLVIALAARRYIHIGTVLSMALTGPSIDVWSWLLSPLFQNLQSLPLRIVLLFAGTVTIAAGVSLYTLPRKGAGASDLVSIILSDRLGRPIRRVRIAVDGVWILLGLLLGARLGLGTAMGLFLTGPVLQGCNSLFMRTPLRRLAPPAAPAPTTIV